MHTLQKSKDRMVDDWNYGSILKSKSDINYGIKGQRTINAPSLIASLGIQHKVNPPAN